MSAEPEFQRLQRHFSAHLRHPDRHPAPDGIEERRLQIYRRLFFNNMEGFIRQGFPVLHSLYEEAAWQRLVRAFFGGHACQTPYFVKIPGEFVEFLSQSYQLEEGDPPFLAELAHYEWMELVLETDETPWPEDVDQEGDLMSAPPYPSPLHQAVAYSWPVHRISADFQPDEPLAEPVWLLVYRDRSHSLGFMEINAMTARLLALMNECPRHSGAYLLEVLAAETHYPDKAGLLRFGADLLAGLRRRDILLGTRRMP